MRAAKYFCTILSQHDAFLNASIHFFIVSMYYYYTAIHINKL